MLRTHTCGALSSADAGTLVTLCGWVANRRDHGGIIFLDLRDRYGMTQVVLDPVFSPEAHAAAEKVRSEFVLQIQGTVRARAAGMENPRMLTGAIEIFAKTLHLLSASKTPPFEIEGEKSVREDLRLEYRYLDLRRERMTKNLILRAQMTKTIRDYFERQGFLEIETPILVKGTPEGSREYLVPSRLFPGQFYVLPQSPQQLKQLSMVAGLDRYFQVARCFRDEDQRGDRQPEFTQVDLEMSFCEQKDILQMVEECIKELTRRHAPEKKIPEHFPVLSWKEAMSRYGSDKPDLRFGLSFVDLSSFAQGCGFSLFEKYPLLFALPVPAHLGSVSRGDIDTFTDIARRHGAGGLAWVRIGEDSGPVAKNATSDFLKNLQDRCQLSAGDLVFFGAAANFGKAVEPLGQVRLALGEHFSLRDPEVFSYLWVTEFPLFERSDDGSIGAVHHPFTRPHPEDEAKLSHDPFSCRSVTHDIVLNGVELGGGSLRIHESILQAQIFDLLGISRSDAERRFGHLLRAFEYGCPPHGGIAFGLDRMVMLFAGEPNIREVIAFPKNQGAADLMLGAPSPLPEEQIQELGIAVLPLGEV